MKRSLLSAVCIIAFTCACFAQDVIVTRDSKRINAKVTEINVDNIKYKMFDHQDGPVYTLPKSDIVTILYQNGQVETFASESSKPAAPAQTPAQTAPAQATPPPYSAAPGRPADLLSAMAVSNPVLYQQHATGKRMLTTGWVLIGVGFGVAATGSYLYEEEMEEEIGTVFLLAGNACIAAGIPLAIIGANKKRGAIRDFSRQYYGSPAPKPHFQINMYPNRLGLAYVF